MSVDIPPNHDGPISEPNNNDVLSGRGGRINAHPGNVQFRELVKQYRGVYLSSETKKLDKAKIAHKIVEIIRNMDPPGRFLKQVDEGAWFEIGDEKARKKAGQAMREKDDSSNNKGNDDSSDNTSRNYSTDHSIHSPLQPFQYTHSPMNQMNQGYHLFQHESAATGNVHANNFNLHHQNVVGNLEPFPNNLSMHDNRHSSLVSNTSTSATATIPYPMDNSMNQSSAIMGRSSLTSPQQSHGHGMFHNSNRPQVMDTRNSSIATNGTSSSHDSWGDQRLPFNDNFNNSTSSMDSARRRQFRRMKFEESCLPAPSLQHIPSPTRNSNNNHVVNNQDNINDLMQESLMSIEMQSKSNFQDKSLASLKMDSVGNFLEGVLESDNLDSSDGIYHSGSRSSKGKQDCSSTDDSKKNSSDQSSMIFDISQSLTMLDLTENP